LSGLSWDPPGWECVERRGGLLQTTWHKRGPLVGSWTTGSSGETSVGTCKLDEAIEKSCSDLLDIYNRKCIHDRMEIF
jgi:hypothetical protein